MIGENRLPRDMTVYQAVQQFGGPVSCIRFNLEKQYVT